MAVKNVGFPSSSEGWVNFVIKDEKSTFSSNLDVWKLLVLLVLLKCDQLHVYSNIQRLKIPNDDLNVTLQMPI